MCASPRTAHHKNNIIMNNIEPNVCVLENMIATSANSIKIIWMSNEMAFIKWINQLEQSVCARCKLNKDIRRSISRSFANIHIGQDDGSSIFEDAEQTITNAATAEGSNNLEMKSSAEQTEATTAAATTTQTMLPSAKRFRAICFNNIPIPSAGGNVQGNDDGVLFYFFSFFSFHFINSICTHFWLSQHSHLHTSRVYNSLAGGNITILSLCEITDSTSPKLCIEHILMRSRDVYENLIEFSTMPLIFLSNSCQHILENLCWHVIN